MKRYRKKTETSQRVPPRMADSILSRLGQLKHCNNRNIYQTLYKGEKIVRSLKKIVRKQRKEQISWSTYLERLRGGA
ncbi:MAG: hypothetical protein IJ058_13470 [Lachnospiraceae bacterium]|nr:hypothetical protein [Lachnospiraceae bacterium]